MISEGEISRSKKWCEKASQLEKNGWVKGYQEGFGECYIHTLDRVHIPYEFPTIRFVHTPWWIDEETGRVVKLNWYVSGYPSASRTNDDNMPTTPDHPRWSEVMKYLKEKWSSQISHMLRINEVIKYWSNLETVYIMPYAACRIYVPTCELPPPWKSPEYDALQLCEA